MSDSVECDICIVISFAIDVYVIN